MVRDVFSLLYQQNWRNESYTGEINSSQRKTKAISNRNKTSHLLCITAIFASNLKKSENSKPTHRLSKGVELLVLCASSIKCITFCLPKLVSARVTVDKVKNFSAMDTDHQV